jgi:hypothetical protein
MWLRDPARIEELLTCHFIAMLISSLIERTIRQAMTNAGLGELSLYPEDRGCAAPTTARILEIFTAVACHELTDLQQQALDLLDIPTRLYQPRHAMPLKAVREVRKAGCGTATLSSTPLKRLKASACR